MLTIGKYGFGFFFTKSEIDYTNKHVAIGFRISWRERMFRDVYFYPRPHVYRCDW